MQKYLITHLEVSEYSREISQHVDQKKIEKYIRESELLDIKKTLGDELYLDIKSNQDKYKLLIEGGEYDNCGHKECFQGLRSALAYYTYARIVKNGDNNVTRFGLVQKDSEYSSGVDFKEKLMAYNDAFSIGDSLLHECIRYLNATKNPLYKGNGKIKVRRMRCKVIGD